MMAAVLVVLLAAGCTSSPETSENSKNVTLRGYTFSLLDSNWLTHPKIETAEGYRWGGSTAGEYGPIADSLIKNYWIGWHGQVMNNAFYLPDERCEGKPSCFDEEDYDKDGNCNGCWPYEPTARVAIYVLDKINPNDLTEDSVLKEAAMLSNGYLFADLMDDKGSEKNITFDERPAYLIENDGIAAMSVDLSPKEVAVIDVNYHDGDPWIDVLEKIKISKSDGDGHAPT
jgi:hypothetical protein